MSDIRSRLAAALCSYSPYFTVNGAAYAAADVLLSLPGIAIVELPEATGPWIVDGSLIYVTSSGAVEMRMPNYADAVKTRALAAALLAAAVQAQEEK